MWERQLAAIHLQPALKKFYKRLYPGLQLLKRGLLIFYLQ
jgi:hypothetical protein